MLRRPGATSSVTSTKWLSTIRHYQMRGFWLTRQRWRRKLCPMHDYRWIDSPEASHLHWGYACVAKVGADGAVSVTGWAPNVYVRERVSRTTSPSVMQGCDVPAERRIKARIRANSSKRSNGLIR